ncbi:uncharacterized protein YacL [Paenibacillus aceris]|uniref:Uncharacterized protein YacL n=1 Tax=Paenibacillus aceris TaxID=869555 RepID=A0ABS4I3T1_9BACL|nr:uncharacterized protein YacL [Paenibacillus aceris]
MKFILEFLRFIIIMVILGGLLASLVINVYSTIGLNINNNAWFIWIAAEILIFVIYRNKLHFSGWYKVKEKLSNSITFVMIICSFILLVIPLFLT